MWPTDRSVIMLRYKQNCTEQKKKEINIFIHISKERDPPKDKTTIWTTGETDIIVCASWFILYTGCCKTDGHLFHGHSVNDDSGDFQRAGKYFFFLRNQQIHHLVLVISLAKILGGPFIHWYIVLLLLFICWMINFIRSIWWYQFDINALRGIRNNFIYYFL